MSKEKICAVRHKLLALFARTDDKIFEQFGFHAGDISLEKVVRYLYSPKDSSSLAVTRTLFGVAMLFDIPGERGGSAMMERWGNPNTCHFALLPYVRAAPMPYMALVYAALWLGAVGITFGYNYRTSAVTFTLCYWYLFFVEKSFWNNHSYLFGLVATLLSFTDAHCYWSIDAARNPSLKKEAVPYWNYFILKFQFFILYFMAGVKKGNAEWLTGYSVQNLSEHWVFDPIKFFLTVPQTDYWVVHWFVFVFDLTVAIWMMWSRTRHVAMLICALFHLMNSRLFSIGMFPWVCLATMPLFYPFDWPKTIGNYLKVLYLNIKEETGNCISLIQKFKRHFKAMKESEEHVKQLMKNEVNQEVKDDLKPLNQITNDNAIINEETGQDNNDAIKNKKYEAKTSKDNINKQSDILKNSGGKGDKLEKSFDGKDKRLKLLTLALISFLMLTQAFLPFSHFITQGYNNWTKGLYGYSWDMMVHTWDSYSIVVKVVDNEKNADFYIDPYLYAPNDRWTKHGDMLYQYAHCMKDNLVSQAKKIGQNSEKILSKNLSIYVDVWYSMNGRFTQRMFDPKQDLLNVSWSPFEPMTYLMPLLDEALVWRSLLQDMRREIYSWHNTTDVIFIADFPGYNQEKYFPTDLNNITLIVLEGKIAFEPDVSSTPDGQSYQLTAGDQIKVNNGMLHKVLNIGETPTYYMYTFVNTIEVDNVTKAATTPKLPIFRELTRHLQNMLNFFFIVITNILKILVQFTRCQHI